MMKYTHQEAENIEKQLDIMIECIQELESKMPATIPIIDKYLNKIKKLKPIKE